MPVAVAPLAAAILFTSCALRAPAGQTAAGGPPSLSLTPAWGADVGSGGGIQAFPAPGGFVVATPEGKLQKFAAADGALAWSTDLGSEIAGPYAVTEAPREGTGGRPWAAILMQDGVVALVPLDAGSPVASWSPAPAPLFLSASGSEILAVAGDGTVRLHSPARGEDLWSATLGGEPSTPGTTCQGMLLIGTKDGKLSALSRENGRVLWRKNLHSEPTVEPACRGHRAFVATRDNQLHALRLRRKRAGTMWRIRAGADPAAPPIAWKGNVVLLSRDTFLYGFREGNGHLLFRVGLERRPGPAARLGDVLFVAGEHAARLDAFRLPQGRSAGGYELPEGARFITPPIVSEGRLAIALGRYGEPASKLVGLAPAAPKPAPAAAPAPSP
jgi:outer membrane protein assembly factor BamB